MEIDNFDQIRQHLKFDDEGDWFYHVQIIIRKKDSGTTIKKNCKTVKSYYIRSLQYYDDHIQQIKDICNYFGARAYIRLNPASWRKCCLKALGEIAEYINSNQCSSLRKLTDEMAGKYNAKCENNEYQKTWIVDVDTKDEGELNAVIDCINNNCQPRDGKHKVIDVIPTLHGYHIISKPFDVRDFTPKFPGIDIHKNNPTLLYFNFLENEI